MATVELVPNVAPLLLHPSATIRGEAARLIGTAAESLEVTMQCNSAAALINTRLLALQATDRVVLLSQSLRPFLKFSLHGLPVTTHLLSLAALPPVSRRSFRRSL